MSTQTPYFGVYPGGQPGNSAAPGPQYQELWFRLARMPWASIVLVPVAPGMSVAEIANALAEVGSALRDAPVTAIVVDAIDYKSTRTLSDLQPRLGAGGWPAAIEVQSSPSQPLAQGAGAAPVATMLSPTGRAIIAIEPILDQPLGIGVAQSADAVVLCLDVGKSRLEAARRTIDLIGPERIVGALLVR